ncbi:hypothetical protein A3K64_01250 [Candidatus Micrarchaeota archaeon RBG_16_36_9]|nr:MAG: hypothetical protein A3K64_01250 [Candidatus Micrarchaeota archaeon RBG_16_36_9]
MSYKILENEKEISEVLKNSPIEYFKSDGEHAVIGTSTGMYVTEIENLQRLENREYRERTLGSETGFGTIAPILGLKTETKGKSSYYRGLSA